MNNPLKKSLNTIRAFLLVKAWHRGMLVTKEGKERNKQEMTNGLLLSRQLRQNHIKHNKKILFKTTKGLVNTPPHILNN